MIDARVACPKNGHGISRYVQTLIRYFATDIEHQDLSHAFEFIILTAADSSFQTEIFPQSFQFFPMRTGWLSLCGQVELLWMIFKHKPALFHAPSFVVPLLSSVPLIATIHDANHIALSENYSFKQKLYYFLLGKKLSKAKKIITVSEFSKSEIIKFMHIPKEKVHVIYNGIDSHFKEKSSYLESHIQTVQLKYKLPAHYIFSAGNPKPHKNLNRLIEAYKSGCFQLPLIILSKGIDQGNIRFLSSVSDEDLPIIYALSDVFVFPSLYEGFGFPPLEALACGIPVASSNTSCLPEVLGDAVLYFNPTSIDEIKKCLASILSLDTKDKEMKQRQGLALVKKFTLKKMAQETLKLYLEIFLSKN